MNHFLNKLERKFGSWAVPALIRYLAVMFFGVFLLSAIFPNLYLMMDFDWKKITSGEVWRLVTFIFAPNAGGFSVIGLLFAFFGMMLMFIFSDALEAEWGVFRANFYVLVGYLTALIGAVLLGWLFNYSPRLPGAYLAMSVMFAFATYNPKFTLMLFFVIPTPIWIIAAIVGVFLGLRVVGGLMIGDYASSLFIIAALSNYLCVVVPMRFSQTRIERGSLARRKSFQPDRSEDEAFHRCDVCGATDITHPEEDFRVGKDGNDYCSKHLPD
ncbi:MAG: hypothetical protein KJO79_10280 [Verrucomicrobiae bacterium]|nr:hypothetical protein [Verrucomicrobiae bacterium]NNJ87557.1 hypothetical protein [Akkermansiaceae bacterium]